MIVPPISVDHVETGVKAKPNQDEGDELERPHDAQHHGRSTVDMNHGVGVGAMVRWSRRTRTEDSDAQIFEKLQQMRSAETKALCQSSDVYLRRVEGIKKGRRSLTHTYT